MQSRTTVPYDNQPLKTDKFRAWRFPYVLSVPPCQSNARAGRSHLVPSGHPVAHVLSIIVVLDFRIRLYWAGGISQAAAPPLLYSLGASPPPSRISRPADP